MISLVDTMRRYLTMTLKCSDWHQIWSVHRFHKDHTFHQIWCCLVELFLHMGAFFKFIWWLWPKTSIVTSHQITLQIGVKYSPNEPLLGTTWIMAIGALVEMLQAFYLLYKFDFQTQTYNSQTSTKPIDTKFGVWIYYIKIEPFAKFGVVWSSCACTREHSLYLLFLNIKNHR
jgi:hypothetical protein